MNCLITCGPTYEPLDQVRRLTNFSTGKLGTGLANFLSEQGHEVLLLRGVQSTYAGPIVRARKEDFTTTEDLNRRLQIHSAEKFDAIFHAAAVSDFRFGKVWRRATDGMLQEISSGKLSTGDGELLAELVPTQKILPQIREWCPKALIVGWKYEVDGTSDEARARALRQLQECRSDFCVLNGPALGAGFQILSARTQSTRFCDSELELFATLHELLMSPKKEMNKAT
jgi:phosphopantothenoylcysteine synthetase/decarboxylase